MFCERLGKAVHQPDDAAAGLQRLRQEHRQDRVKHLGRDIGEQAREREKVGVPRKAGEISLHSGSFGHTSSPSASAMPPSALTTTTSNGGARHTVRRTKPTSAMPKSPGVLTELVQTGL